MTDIKPLIIIAGPTAVGKTALSLALAQKIGGEIISADSMQVYKHISIGTAKPGSEETGEIPYYLIDHVNPDEQYNLGRFITEAENHIKIISENQHFPIICGGTGLYIKGLLYGVFQGGEAQPEIRKRLETEYYTFGLPYLYELLQRVDPGANHVMPNDKQRIIRYLEVYYSTGTPLSELHKEDTERPRYKNFSIRLTASRQLLYERINQRVDKMVEVGLLEEVQNYLQKGYSILNPAINAIGYQEVISYLQGDQTLEMALNIMKQKSRNYAKRQETWFSKQPFDLIIDIEKFQFEELVNLICNNLKQRNMLE